MSIYLISEEGDRILVDSKKAFFSDFIRKNISFGGKEFETGEIKIPVNTDTVQILADLFKIIEDDDKIRNYLEQFQPAELLNIKDLFEFLFLDTKTIDDIFLEKLSEEYPELNRSVIVYTIKGYPLTILNIETIGIFKTLKQAYQFLPPLKDLDKYKVGDKEIYWIERTLIEKFPNSTFLVIEGIRDGEFDPDLNIFKQIFDDRYKQLPLEFVDPRTIRLPDLPPL